jgi:hypothetical protein
VKKITAFILGFLLLISIPAWAIELTLVGAHTATWDYEAVCASYNLYWSSDVSVLRENQPAPNKTSASIPQPSAGTAGPPASVDYHLVQSLSISGTYFIAVTCVNANGESVLSNVVPFCLDHSTSADRDVFSGYAGTCPCLAFIAAPIGGNTDKIDAAGGLKMARVLNGPGCKWTAGSLSPWITIDADFLAGVGDGWIRYIVQPNTTGLVRKGIVSASGKYLVITQSK